MTAEQIIENHTFNEIGIGDTARLTKTLTRDDLTLYAALFSQAAPQQMGFLGFPTETSALGGMLLSAALSTRLPGPGTKFVNQSLQFRRPIAIGATLTTTLTVREKNPATNLVTVDCECVDEGGAVVMSGRAEVIAPTEKFLGRGGQGPEIRVWRHEKYDALIARAAATKPIATAVAYPCDATSLEAALDAAEAKIIAPKLVGPAKKIREIAEKMNADLSSCEIVDAGTPRASAEKAVELIRSGAATLIMKGSLHTDELLGAIVKREAGLRTERRISHCFVLDIPTYPKPLIITDAAVNIAPSLTEKVDIIQNAIDFARALGLERPRVAIVSAVETVNPKIPTTLEAAALCKMADRGQITGAIVDGPLALDNAISKAAADIKGIVSPIDGQADILMVPDLEAGNMIYKNLSFLADADGAGVVLGARVPVILTSRADSLRTRLASCALASLFVQRYRPAE